MQARFTAKGQTSLNGATAISTGPVNVEFPGLAKSAWNRKRFRSLESARSTKKLGEPDGGSVLPSRSEGSRLATLLWKQICVAAAPASIAARFSAQAPRPQERERSAEGLEHVLAGIIGVGPDAELGIVGELVAEVELIAVVVAGGIRREGVREATLVA